MRKVSLGKEYSLCMVGSFRKQKFRYMGFGIDAILVRFPTAQILDETNGTFIVSAEVFGKGIGMWLKSQGDHIKILS